MSNYYSLKASYSQTDTDGLYYFKVTSSGSTLSEFKKNTRILILKQLLYEGFVNKDIKVNPLLVNSELQKNLRLMSINI
jgi:hypothetical protein